MGGNLLGKRRLVRIVSGLAPGVFPSVRCVEALDPVERYETVRPSIDDDVLRGALEASINERGLSHFNDETFTKVSGLLYRCADIARDGSAGARRLR